MYIPVPIGIKRVAAVQGAVWKQVTCESCGERYAYLLELEGTGEDLDLLFLNADRSADRARAKAEENLVQKSRNIVVAVPCPQCGHYQDDMARNMKNEFSINAFQIAGIVIALISLIPLAFDIPYLWVLTLVLAIIGTAVLAWGYVVAFRFDPNSGKPGPRIAIGRQSSVWGEQLAELLATNPPMESGRSPGRDGK